MQIFSTDPLSFLLRKTIFLVFLSKEEKLQAPNYPRPVGEKIKAGFCDQFCLWLMVFINSVLPPRLHSEHEISERSVWVLCGKVSGQIKLAGNHLDFLRERFQTVAECLPLASSFAPVPSHGRRRDRGQKGQPQFLNLLLVSTGFCAINVSLLNL